jgi:hypothetical protein
MASVTSRIVGSSLGPTVDGPRAGYVMVALAAQPPMSAVKVRPRIGAQNLHAGPSH